MREKNIHRLFELSVMLKGLHALLELLTAGAAVALKPDSVFSFLLALARREAEHPYVSSLLVYAAATVSDASQRFAGIYLAAHGLINLALVIGLFAGALWAYPAALGAIAVFIGYQVYRYTQTEGISLIFLTVLDIAVWWLVWHEYRVLREDRARGAA